MEGPTAFTVHSATTQPVPLPVSLHCLGTIPARSSEWALVWGMAGVFSAATLLWSLPFC